MYGVIGRYTLLVLLLLAAVCSASAQAQESTALEVQPGSTETFSLAAGDDAAGETEAYEKPLSGQQSQIFSAGALELWRNISANYRLAGDILVQLGAALETAADDPAARLSVWQEYGPLLVETRNRLNDLRHIVDKRRDDGGAQEGTEQLAYAVWHDDLNRVINKLDNDVIVLDREASFFQGMVSDVYTDAFDTVYESPMESTPWGGETQKEQPRAEWEYEADFGYQSGTSTYAENASYTYDFAQILTAAGGNEYEFYQSYNHDLSYVESENFSFGAKQKIEDILWNGDLRLEEEFSRYLDFDDSSNNLQEGEFKMRFDPEWSDGRWAADVDYKYNVKVYETFSSRSYKLNSGKLKLEHEFSKDLAGEVSSSFDDYNYSIGSDRGNSKNDVGGSLDWDVSNDLSLGFDTSLENKHYDVRKDRNHEKLDYNFDLSWKADDDSQLSVKQSSTNYSRYYDPGENYDETSTSLSYRRSLSEELDVDLKWTTRDKQFEVDPLDDTEQTGYSYGVNYNPAEDWNLSYSFDAKDYGFVDPVREYETLGHRAGLRYTHHNIGIGLDYSLSENDYAADALRNYTRDDYNLDFDYRFDQHSVRVYYGVGYLDQADPASVNDYTESRVGASWDYELNDTTDLSLSYDFNERDYDGQPLQEDNRLQARISFRF
jgi:hypothetical protein